MDNNSMNFHNIMDSIEDDCKTKKAKESVLLLKRKMCKTHDLIKQYSENVKEIDNLKLNLEIAKKEGIHTICNYKTAMDKIKELQLKITEDKQKSEKLINQINEYEINIAADKQTIQQLICKIKNLENKCSAKDMEYDLQKSGFEDRINDLEYELKITKGIAKKKAKKTIATDSDTTKLSIGTKSSSNIGINVSLCDKEISAKCETQDKSIMTDEFYNMKGDPHPLFCAKCEVHLSPDITPELICRSMSAYPKLIEKNLSPLKKVSSPPPPPLISSTYLDSTNRIVNVPSRKIVPHMNPYSQDNDSVMSNLNSQSGRSSAMTQIYENVELKNVDISRIPVATNNCLDSMSTALAWTQKRNGMEDFCSDDLLAKHSSSIKEMERKIRLLDSKVKKFRRFKKKLDNNSCCRRSMNYNDDILLNSNLLTIICKSVAEYYDEKKEACSKKRDIDSEKCTCSTKKLKRMQQLNKSNACKNTCLTCKMENRDKKCQVRDTFCNETKNATKTDILQCDHKLSVHDNSFSDINTSNTSLNDIDESDKREVVLHEKNILHLAVSSVEDNVTTSCSADEMYANDNLLDKDNEEAMDVYNGTETETIVLFNDENEDENSTNHIDSKVVDNNRERNEIKSKAQDISKNKVGEIYAHDNLLNEDHVKAIDIDNRTETETTLLSNNENSNHIKSKIIDNNTERNEINSKAQDIFKDNDGEIYACDNLLNEDHVKALDIDNQTETETRVLCNNENFTNHIKGKIVDNNAEKNEIKSKAEGIHKDKIDETYARGNFLNEDNTEDTDIDCQIETETIFSNDDNFTDHVDGKIVDINAEKNITQSKTQNIHEDNISKIHISDNLLNNDNVKTININKRAETTVLSNNESSIDHTDDKIIDIKTEENITQSKTQNIHEDNIGEIHVSDNLLNKDNVKTVNMNKRAETTVLSDGENSTEHTDDKIVDINAEENEIKSKGQTISEDKAGETYASDNLLSKNNNVQTIDINNQTETGIAVLSNENFSDHTYGKIHKAEKNDIKSKAQSIHKDKVGEIYISDNLLNEDNVLSKGNIEAVDMDKQTKTKQTVLPDDENSTNCTKIKIIKCNLNESKIKKKGQSTPKGNVGDRIFKKIRKLKRKTQANSCISKQENVKSCSSYNQLQKKLRIENKEESGDRLLTSVTSLKRKLGTEVKSINKQEDNKLLDNDYEPAKKLRIAHNPKTPVPQSRINTNNFTHSTIKSLATLATRSSSRNEQLNRQKGHLLTESKQSRTINKKCNEKNIKSCETNSTDKRSTNEKNLDLTNAEDCLQSKDIASPVVCEFEKCDDVLTENTDDRSISMNRATGKTSGDELNVLHNNTANDTVNDLELKKLSIPLRKCTITQLKGNKVLCKDLSSKYNRLTEPLKTTETSKEITPTVGLQCDSYKALGNENQDDHKIMKDVISNGKSLILHDQSKVSEATRNESHNNDVFDRITEIRSPSPDSGIIVEDCTNDSNMKESRDKIKDADIRKETCINNETIEIRAETRKGNVSQQSNEMKYINEVEISHEVEKFEMPITKRLAKYIQKKPIKQYNTFRRQQKTDAIKTTDIFVKSQLKKLIDSDWEATIHDDIVDKLGYTCGPRIIAKCILEFLSEEVDPDETLDKSFTPPAPLMKTFEQKIITLLIDLEVLKPTVISFVQAAIEYNLFRLNYNDVKFGLVESLTRIYVVLSRIQKDREKVRMMCCNALYCMNRKTIDVLYTVLTCWPEVLPNAEANKGLLPKCIAFLTNSEDFNKSVKLKTLKSYLIRYYKYNFAQETASDIAKELMTALKAERIDGLDTAIILFAKRKGPDWTNENIIQTALLPMIINNEHPCVYSAFSLLGRLLRAFPLKNLEKNSGKNLEENNNIVKNISEQLRDLIKSGEGSHDQQEGIISAMLSLSRHEFDIIAPFVIKWTPSKSLRPISNRQIEAFINSRNAKFWKSYLESL